MKLIIPMAGQGSRLRPHTLTTPKPLLPVAGPMLIERIVRSFMDSIEQPIEEIAFILGDFGSHVEDNLSHMAQNLGAKPSFYYQKEAKGTAHAVHCAAPSLKGEVIVAFADTLFKTQGKITLSEADSIIWLKKVEDPSRYGVAIMDQGRITGFVEKPKERISDLAIIGVYYFKEGERLLREIQYLIDHDIRGHKSEYDLTDAIDRMLKQKADFRAADVTQWLDFGTIPAWLESTSIILDEQQQTLPDTLKQSNSKIIPPCYIGNGVELKNAVIGPYACIGDQCTIIDSSIEHSVVRDHTTIRHSSLSNSTIGMHASIRHLKGQTHAGDYSIVSD
ncbi:sugar phosphate nucleotidyltransferase [Balneolaceae bacterium ANBcel3]|nr:sugar phosphate nucleotidyltransferase [Balneolaceae bacterium ANBcel3]